MMFQELGLIHPIHLLQAATTYTVTAQTGQNPYGYVRSYSGTNFM